MVVTPAMKLFVLVSTRQKVANLPPVLELARPGDHVLWVESDEARRGAWTAGPQAVLQSFGLREQQRIAIEHVNDPALLKQVLEPTATQLRGRFESVYLVTNGGTKHTPIGLVVAFHTLSPMILYGEESPCVYRIFSSNLNSQADVRYYTNHHLDLPNILQVNGFTFATGEEGTRIWPDSLRSTVKDEKYGINEDYTYQLHQKHYAWSSANQPANHLRQSRVNFSEIPQLVPQEYEKWIKTLKQLRHSLNEQNMTNLYYATLNLADCASKALVKKQAGVQPPPARLGDALERAVAYRLWKWQEANKHPAIQSIWTGVRIARENTPDKVDAEFDILLVLKNGILWHLECKSSRAEPRDLDVNAHRLQQVSSQLAQSAVVVPLFTRCTSQPWFSRLHRLRRELEEAAGAGRTVIPFTIPGQPREYVVTDDGTSLTFTCPSFEDSLNFLLNRYRSESPSGGVRPGNP